MDNDKIKKNREYSEEAFWTGHYHFLMQALAVAMSRCVVWRLVGDGTPYTVKELFNFAKQQDEEHELTDPSFFMVSREGAIGLSPGLEYLTQWLFIPMEPGKERDYYERLLRERLQEEEAAERAVKEAVDAGLARERKDSPVKYYMVDSNKKRLGPLTIEELLKNGLTSDTYVWTKGMSQWEKAANVEALATLLRSSGR